MHLAGATYDELVATFQWRVPQRFNVAEAVVTRHARATPDAPALIVAMDRSDPQVWTFLEVERAANRLANALASLGVRRGDILALHLTQSAETLITHVAASKLGLIVMPLFVLFGPEAVRYRIDDSGAAVLVTTTASLEAVAVDIAACPSLRHIITVDGRGPLGAHSLATLMDAAAHTTVSNNSAAEDPAYLLYTSGTTGNPKGVLHAQRVVIGHLPGVMVPSRFFPQPGDCFWTPADWAWVAGLFDVLMPALYHGVPVVASRSGRFDPEAAFALMARHKVRNLLLPPTAMRLMRAVPNPRERFAYHVRSLISGGEPVGADMIAWGEDTFGFKLSEVYGQTECNIVVGNNPDIMPVKPGSMGRAMPGHTVAIVDDAGNVLPRGATGIVAVKRPDPVMFLEYWKRPEATREKFRGDWCLLGDVAVEDEDGYLWFQGRDDDIIKSSGYRIGPGEVEDCLARHPAVAIAGVVGTPDPMRGEAVTAFVVAKPGVVPSAELAAEIQAFVKERLAAHESPRKVHFIAEMPLTVTGKLRRVELRKLDAELTPVNSPRA
ncbi:MAG TPA: AMP-binding protein [Hyphomicrobiaceae bacterium]|nr:AMP-binding protein [Hyphomicrobiaceae bacterium]